MLDEGALMPVRAYPTDAGLDLKTPKAFSISAHSSFIVDTGVHIELPDNTVGMIKSRSGLNVKKGIVCEGVIDVGYTGSICVKLYNHSNEFVPFRMGDRIAQLVVMPVLFPDLEVVDEFKETQRGTGGFGSTGK